MKTLYILRHAKSSWEFAQLDDRDRPLNNRGRADAQRMGQELANRHVSPDLIISSPAVRALATATLVGKELSYGPDQIVVKDQVYAAGKQGLLEVVQQAPATAEVLLLVGHNESLSDFANLLSPENLPRLPTAGVAALQFTCDAWQNINRTNASLLFFDIPKNYR